MLGDDLKIRDLSSRQASVIVRREADITSAFSRAYSAAAFHPSASSMGRRRARKVFSIAVKARSREAQKEEQGKKAISHGSICVRGGRFSTLQLTGLSAGTEGGEPTKVNNQQLYAMVCKLSIFTSPSMRLKILLTQDPAHKAPIKSSRTRGSIVFHSMEKHTAHICQSYALRLTPRETAGSPLRANLSAFIVHLPQTQRAGCGANAYRRGGH
ncbi:hypothetical protein LUU34_00232100 [Aix galericulata]|nr:hypothetical protein LUU34_00232100 [Aix galericulata]